LNGVARAQCEVARCFYYGLGTRKNYRTAVEWYQKAAKRGDMEAQFALGVAFERGQGVRQNIRRAMSWHEKAAEIGHEKAKRVVAMGLKIE
jgi:TPR repeat protein